VSSAPGPEGLTIIVPARNEAERIGETLAALRRDFPDAELIVVDGRSEDGTAERAEEDGAVVIRIERLGKGEALSAGERAAAPGPLLLADADLRGSLRPLAQSDADLVVAAFARRVGGGFGLAKRVARELVRLRTGVAPREPLSGQRLLGARARAACFPLAPGFGAEVRMTIDALNAGLTLEEVELDLGHRPTGRDAAGFVHRGRQLLDAVLASGPLDVNHRGLRLPLAGWVTGVARDPAITAVMLLGAADDALAGEERGFRQHLHARRTTGVLKAVGIPLVGLWRTRSVSGALLFALSANVLNQLDTRPGRCLKAYLLAAVPLRAPAGLAVLLLPYDLAERAMLGDAGSNALGAVLGLKSVDRLHGWARWAAIGMLAGLNLLGERTSIGRLIERTPGLRELDRLGRLP
jgi:Glycosyl transferase family 2